jgi:hypothetical protein
VRASKQELVDVIADGVKNGSVSIPGKPSLEWNVPQTFTTEDLG